MDPLYIFFLCAIGIMIAIGVGLELSNGIEEFVIYVLFWMLYITTIATFINICVVANYYLTMKNKTGPNGLPGPSGDKGEKGDVGKCDPTCRDSICENQILDMITNELKTRDNNSDKIRFNNTYIKSKVHQMCASDEFKQLAPYKGPSTLIKYLIDTWKTWFDLLYDAGGSTYFENIGAESDFDWLSDNPFNEIKQYDVFYWGMGSQYKPQLSNCATTSGIDNGNGQIIRASLTTLYDYIGNDDSSGSQTQVSFWRAKQYTYEGTVYYPVGDIAIGPMRDNDSQNLTRHVGATILPDKSIGPNRETIIISGDVKGPIDYDLIWSNESNNTSSNNITTNNNAFWLWRPIAPIGYISLGDVVTFSAVRPLTGNNAPIRCVPFDIVKRVTPNGNRLWSSFGSSSLNNVMLLGFVPNSKTGEFVSAGTDTSYSNCYNLFRSVVGMNASIPESDINGGFYYLDSSKYDSQYQIGADTTINKNSLDTSASGTTIFNNLPKTDAKYSVMAYVNLKANPVLLHNMTNKKFNGKLIPNAISNAYLISVNSSSSSGNSRITKCLNYKNNAIILSSCDELISSEIFSIVFTGNKKNECKIQHYDTKLIVNYDKNGLFTLVSPTETNNIDYQLFTME